MTTTPIYDKVFATLQARAALNGAQLVRTDPADGVTRYFLAPGGPPQLRMVREIPAADLVRYLGTS
jgi:hypothetical protein